MINREVYEKDPGPRTAAQPGRRQGHQRPDRPPNWRRSATSSPTSSATASTPKG